MENSRLWLVLWNYEKNTRIYHIKGHRSSQCGYQCGFIPWKDSFHKTLVEREDEVGKWVLQEMVLSGDVAGALNTSWKTHRELNEKLQYLDKKDAMFCVKAAKSLCPFPSCFRETCNLPCEWWWWQSFNGNFKQIEVHIRNITD